MTIYERVFAVLEPISVIIGIVTFFPVILTLWKVTVGEKKQRNKIFKEICNHKGERPAILVVDLKPDADIWLQVSKTIQENAQLKSVPQDRIFRINRTKWLEPEHMPDLVDELREKIGAIMSAGVDSLFLIYAGPVTPMAIIGAELANCCRVILFQHHQGAYMNWGPLKHR